MLLIHSYCSLTIRDVHKLVDPLKSRRLVFACGKEGTKCGSAILSAEKLDSNCTHT